MVQGQIHDKEKLLVLIGSIYDAGADCAHWASFLHQLCEAVSSHSSTLLIHDLHSRRATLSVHVDSRKRSAGRDGPNEHTLGRVIVRKEGVTSVLTCLRPRSMRAYGKGEHRLVDLLVPHLARAVELHRRLCRAQLESELGVRALDYLAHGVVLVDDDGKVIIMNQLAKCILSQNDGLRILNNSLTAGKQETDAELQCLLKRAAGNDTEFRFAGGGALLVERPSRKRPFSILVSPLKAHPFFLDRHSAAAAVFISDPESQIEAPEQLLFRLYGLTPAESRLALMLMQGCNLSESARRIGIKRNTAHTQLQSIYAKTLVGRQSELIALLLRGISTIRQTPGDSDAASKTRVQ